MSLRSDALLALKTQSFDVLIVGSGINGAVSAAALAAKGAKVALIDQGDFGGFTSSNSSNLAWGGIKYLESHEYLLVNKLCKSRNLLMRSYPSTVKEIRFLTSIQKGFRFSPLFIFLGTVFYWIVGRFFTQPPRLLNAKKIKQQEPAVNANNLAGGVEYSDAYLFDNDARFVFNFVRSSMNNGAVAANYVRSESAEYKNHLWTCVAKDLESGEEFPITAKVMINACGPHVDTHNAKTQEVTEYRHVFSKGVHLIVDRVGANDRVLAFFASDGRLFFVIPMGRKTCIGTTDSPTDNAFDGVSKADRDFILANANALLDLAQPLTENDVIAERCGVRPLAVKGSHSDSGWLDLSRKHVIETNARTCHISIFGGKLTDCLNVGEEVAELVASLGVALSPLNEAWYGEPGAELKQQFFARAAAMRLDELTWSEASEPLSQRFWRRYGKNAFQMLDAIAEDRTQADLLIENAEYTRCEIEYTNAAEMITKLEDFLRRRSKISLVLRHDELIAAEGLRRACEIFFGERAEEKLQQYLDARKSLA